MTLRGKTPKRKRFSPATVATVTDWSSAITLIFLFESVGSTCMLRYYLSLLKAFLLKYERWGETECCGPRDNLVLNIELFQTRSIVLYYCFSLVMKVLFNFSLFQSPYCPEIAGHFLLAPRCFVFRCEQGRHCSLRLSFQRIFFTF